MMIEVTEKGLSPMQKEEWRKISIKMGWFLEHGDGRRKVKGRLIIKMYAIKRILKGEPSLIGID